MDKYTKSVLTVIAVFCQKVESGHSNIDLMGAPMRFLALVTLSAALTACSGTGVQYDQQVEKSVTTPDGTAFIAREGQWIGGGVLLKVVLNGTQLGELGNNEILSGKIKEGPNTLTVKPQGMGKLSYSDESFNFQGALDKNSYFMIDLNNTLLGFGSSIVITETTEASFKANAQ